MPTTSFSPLLSVFILPTFVLLCASPVNAKDACEKHLKITCNSCHTLDAPCEQLGNPPKELKSLLSRMKINGAELSNDDIDALATCLSQPSAAAKIACGK